MFFYDIKKYSLAKINFTPYRSILVTSYYLGAHVYIIIIYSLANANKTELAACYSIFDSWGCPDDRNCFRAKQVTIRRN